MEGHRALRTILRAVRWILLVAAVASLADAQTQNPLSRDNSGSDTVDHSQSGYISGTILDQSGAVSREAEVRLLRDQSVETEVRSGENGQFVFARVEPGPFRLSVTSSGFKPQEVSGTLRSGEAFVIPPIILVVAAEVTEVSVKEKPLTQVELAALQIKEQEKQRVFGFIPNFSVTYDPDAVPLTSKQKFGLFSKTLSDPFTIVGIAALAGVQQATDAHSGYGQGASGYAKRFGASYTDAFTSTLIGGALLPSLFKQDPRYFYKGSGKTGARLLHALANPVICKGDNRVWQPNYSNIFGSVAAGGISYLYYPDSDHDGAGLIFQNAMIRLGETALVGVLQEFLVRRLTPHLPVRPSP